jgi:IS5 family transposase
VLFESFYPKAGGGRKPYPLETMLRIHLLQNWFSLSDPAMGEALYEITPMRQFASLTMSALIPEDTTIMNFRHLLEKHKLESAILAIINGYLQGRGFSLRQGTIVDVTIIHAPSSTKNEDGKRDPEMHTFRVINRQFGYVKVRFRGLMKNTAQLTTLFALSNLWMVRKQLMGMGELRM